MTENKFQKGTLKDMFITSSGRRVTFIVWGLFFCQQMSGISVITFYTEPIFKMTGSSISSSVSAVIFSVFNVIMGAVSPLLVNHFGYKKPLIVSAALMFLAQVSILTELINVPTCIFFIVKVIFTHSHIQQILQTNRKGFQNFKH